MSAEKELTEPTFDYDEREPVTLEQILSDAQKKWPGILPAEIVIHSRSNRLYDGGDLNLYLEVEAVEAYLRRVSPQT